ncbi:hypothetical protein K439DRAFT_1664150 [Ramaria rubella]|nr:hypothetical protein K439DRAFT_1664150 [Ramaria rubella]
MIAGLHVVTESQIQYLSESLTKYETHCTRVTKDYGKNYNYPKHHGLTHLADDLQRKGFQQEVQEAYDQTNYRNTEPQMVRIDENQEAMAHIRMAIDMQDKRHQEAFAVENATDDGEPPPEPVQSEHHWALGARQKKIYARQVEEQNGDAAFRHFDSRLQTFLAETLPEESRPSEHLKITPYQCVYPNYRSLEDWTVKQDILRCNPCFHGNEHYDCVVINTEPLTFGRLQYVFSCEDNKGRTCDLALIRIFQLSNWSPATKWEGCHVLEEKNYRFVMLKYLLRGCHMIPTFEKKVGRYYLNDLVDAFF